MGLILRFMSISLLLMLDTVRHLMIFMTHLLIFFLGGRGDWTVTPDSQSIVNQLVVFSADDSKIIGICGETKLTNVEGSWWTMIQVYEYYISHHLSKAFESLFGSVTRLPGCLSLYCVCT